MVERLEPYCEHNFKVRRDFTKEWKIHHFFRDLGLCYIPDIATLEEIEEVWQAGGKLPLVEALRCRVRYFTDGAVLGGQRYVDDFFDRKREYFGESRKDGGRKMRGAQWGELRALRDLQKDVLCVSS